MFNLLPRDTVFFDLFEGMARHVVAAAENQNQLARKFPDITAEVQRIREHEHAADELAHQALHRLDRTFITPFDREDIHTLVGRLDDIIDSIDALAKRFPLFHVTTMEPTFREQTAVLVQASVAVSEAVHRLRKSRKLSELSDKLIEIHDTESRGDEVEERRPGDRRRRRQHPGRDDRRDRVRRVVEPVQEVEDQGDEDEEDDQPERGDRRGGGRRVDGRGGR